MLWKKQSSNNIETLIDELNLKHNNVMTLPDATSQIRTS